MKKSKIFLKALISIPLGIFCLELFNIIISLECGKYIRIECLENGINLNDVITSYVYCIISSYLLGIAAFYSNETMKKEISPSEKRKQNNKVVMPVFGIVFILFAISLYLNPNSYAIFGFFSSFIWSGIAMMIFGVKDLLDKNTVKQINKKIKESIKRMDPN